MKNVNDAVMSPADSLRCSAGLEVAGVFVEAVISRKAHRIAVSVHPAVIQCEQCSPRVTPCALMTRANLFGALQDSAGSTNLFADFEPLDGLFSATRWERQQGRRNVWAGRPVVTGLADLRKHLMKNPAFDRSSVRAAACKNDAVKAGLGHKNHFLPTARGVHGNGHFFVILEASNGVLIFGDVRHLTNVLGT